MTPPALLVDALAAARLTRLWTQDSFPPVVATQRRAYAVLHERHGVVWAEGLTSCPWCVGVWAAGGVVLARRAAPRAWAPLADLLAAAWVAGWANTR